MRSKYNVVPCRPADKPTPMPKKEKKRLQVVISDEQDSLLTKAAYELSSPERLVSKSEVVRVAIEKLSKELSEGKVNLDDLIKELGEEEGGK